MHRCLNMFMSSSRWHFRTADDRLISRLLQLLFTLALLVGTIQIDVLCIAPDQEIEKHAQCAHAHRCDVEVVAKVLLVVQLAIASRSTLTVPNQARTVDDVAKQDGSRYQCKQTNQHQRETLRQRFVLHGDDTI